MLDLNAFITRVGAEHDPSRMFATLQEELRRVAHCYVSYLPLPAKGDIHQLRDRVVFSSFPDRWVYHYVDNALFEVDPVIELSKKRGAPFYWLTEHLPDHSDPEKRELLRLLSEYGIGGGLAVPLFREGAFSAIYSVGFDPAMRVVPDPDGLSALTRVLALSLHAAVSSAPKIEDEVTAHIIERETAFF